MKKVAQIVADFLADKGVTDVFTITGGGAMHLNDALGHSPRLKCTYNHHEQACSIAAEGYARLTGKIAAVCVTSGPGGTNAITGVMGGYLDSVPMFVISGQVKRETTLWSVPDLKLRQLGDQEFPIVDAVSCMTKYAVMITEPNDIYYHLEKAWCLANSGRKGPVWLDIPLDVQAAPVEENELRHFEGSEEEKEILAQEKPVYDDALTKEILEKISKAERPVMIVGEGIRFAGVKDKMLKVMDMLKIPVVTAWNAHDLVADDNPYYCGRPGTVGTRGGNFVMQGSDLILSMGCRLNIRQISYNFAGWSPDAYKIMVDIDEAELNKPTIKIDMKVHADVTDVLDSIIASGFDGGDTHAEWLKWSRDVDAKYPACIPSYESKKSPINPYVFIDRFSKVLAEDDAVICGNGSACVVTFQGMHVKDETRLFTNSGCAAMGYGFPAALGCAVARGDKRTICVDGDGSFQMNIQEMQTVIYNQLPLKTFIINNNGYHSIRQTQTNLFKPPLVGVCEGNGVSFPDFSKVAYAFDIPYVKIDKEEDIEQVITNLLDSEGPYICEVFVDEKQNFEPKLSSKVLPDGRIVSPEPDDMYPFLSREEYESNKISD